MIPDTSIDLRTGTATGIARQIFDASFAPGDTAGHDMAASRARRMLDALVVRLVELRDAGLPLSLEALHDGLLLVGTPVRPGYLDLAHEGDAPGTPAQHSMREVLAALPRAAQSWKPGDELPLAFQERFGLMAMPFRATLKAMLKDGSARPS